MVEVVVRAVVGAIVVAEVVVVDVVVGSTVDVILPDRVAVGDSVKVPFSSVLVEFV